MNKYTLFNFFTPTVLFEGEDEGGTGGGAGEVLTSPAAPEAPWQGAEGTWTLGEGETATPWYAAISEESVRKHVEAKNYANPAELAMANYQLNKLQRGDPTVIALPGENATAEELGEFYGKLGRPAEPAGYEFTFAEGVTPDDTMVEFGRNTFHKAGLTPQQAQIVSDAWNEFAAEQNGAAQTKTTEQNTAEMQALETKWGADLAKHQAAGQRAVKALGVSTELINKLEQNMGTAAVVELMSQIGMKSAEGGFLSGDTNANPDDPATMSREQAQARIKQLDGDAEFQKKYTDKLHPGHADAVSMMERLYSRV